jgi:hypothetical protein
MGAIAPSKVPKLIKKRDGNEPVKVFKQGGKVRRFKEGGESDDMLRDIEARQKSKRESSSGFRFETKGRDDPSGLRFEGGGGKDEYATSAGGRLSYDMSMGKNATLSPYVEGFLAKPKDRKLTGRATGAGVVYNKRFKSGGATTKSKVNQAGNYTKPGMRESLFKSIKARAVQGTGAGQWSARKAQLLAKNYKAKGGGYKG